MSRGDGKTANKELGSEKIRDPGLNGGGGFAKGHRLHGAVVGEREASQDELGCAVRLETRGGSHALVTQCGVGTGSTRPYDVARSMNLPVKAIVGWLETLQRREKAEEG